MKNVNFKVEGMSCSHCEHRVCKNLLDIKGIKAASASANDKKVSVKYDESLVDEKTIADKITELGYNVVRTFTSI